MEKNDQLTTKMPARSLTLQERYTFCQSCRLSTRPSQLLLVITIMFFCSTITWAASSRCEEYLVPKYDVELPDFPRVQQCSGTCYFEGVVGLLDAYFVTNYDQPRYISRPHLFSLLLQSRFRRSLVGNGGRLPRYKREHNFGIDYRTGSPQFFNLLRPLIGFTKSDGFDHMPDIVSGGSFEEVDRIVSSNLLLLVSSRTAAQNYKDTAQMKSLLVEAHRRLDKATKKLSNIFQEQETNDLRKLSPDAIQGVVSITLDAADDFDNYLEEFRTQLIEQSPNADLVGGLSALKGYFFEKMVVVPELHKQIQRLIVAQVNRSLPILIEYDVYKNTAHGVLRGPVDYNGVPTNADWAQSKGLMTHKDWGRHLSSIVGYRLNQSGQIEALKIRNSWGNASGDHGYLHMPWSYFVQHAHKLRYMKPVLIR